MSQHHEHEARERNHRHKHVATWVAAAGTLAVIMALWAMLLPTQLGGNNSFGIKNAPSWLAGRAQGETVNNTGAGFQEALLRTQATLDKMEELERVDVLRQKREQALRQEADILRAKIEASAVLNENPVE